MGIIFWQTLFGKKTCNNYFANVNRRRHDFHSYSHGFVHGNRMSIGVETVSIRETLLCERREWKTMCCCNIRAREHDPTTYSIIECEYLSWNKQNSFKSSNQLFLPSDCCGIVTMSRRFGKCHTMVGQKSMYIFQKYTKVWSSLKLYG